MKKALFTTIIITLTFFACKTNNNSSENTKTPESVVKNKNTISFTNEQIEMAEIKIGRIEKQVLSNEIECTGIIEAPPDNIAVISAPMEGFVKKAPYLPGEYVKAGTQLALLEHSGYITLQQEYLKTKATYEYYKEEFKRQGELSLENAAPMKKMQNAEAEFKSIEASYKALAEQLSLIGINPNKLTSENINSTISIAAPISGYITKAYAVPGMFISSNNPLYEITDKNQLNLKLKIFEKDFNLLTPKQKLSFKIETNNVNTYKAEIKFINQMVDETDHSIQVIAQILSSTKNLIPGMYVNANIALNNSPVYAVPITAIVRNGNKFAIFMAEGNNFTKYPIETGIEELQYTEIKHPEPQLLSGNIVIEGAYYIESELAKNSGEN